jgi:hypothetical protein
MSSSDSTRSNPVDLGSLDLGSLTKETALLLEKVERTCLALQSICTGISH